MTGTRKRRAYYARRWNRENGNVGPCSRKRWAIRNRWKWLDVSLNGETGGMTLGPMWVWRKVKGGAA